MGETFWFTNVPESVQQYVASYHVSLRENKILGYPQCAEITGFSYWNGLVEDSVARNYTAQLIQAELNIEVDKMKVVAFSAMEGVSFLNTVHKFNKKNGANIQVANVRALSNYNHPRFIVDEQMQVQPVILSMDSIAGLCKLNWSTYFVVTEGFQSGGYQHAILSASGLILHYFKHKL